MCEDYDGFIMKFRDWDPTSRQQFLIQIKEQLC